MAIGAFLPSYFLILLEFRAMQEWNKLAAETCNIICFYQLMYFLLGACP